MPASSGLNALQDQEQSQALLIGSSRGRSRRASWVAHPFWLLPLVLITSMSRGATMSPRIQVYKAVACRTLNQGGSLPGPSSSGSLSSFIDCSGPEVQARAARIQASVVTSMNLLSAVSTGFWSRFGDTYGRKPVIGLFLVGAIAMEFVHVLVMRPESIFGKHAESFILVGPILEGMVGALSSFNGVVHAYTADCTRHGSRSKIFSTIQGIIFVGLAIGPWFSGLVLPESAILKVENAFYLSIALMGATLVYLVLILPESRQPTPDEMGAPSESHIQFKMSPFLVLRRYLHRFISALIIPVTVFAPRHLTGQPRRKNYNLTFVGAAIFIYVLSNSVYTIKYLYAQHVYDWTTAQLGYYMSFLWIANAVNLLVLLPFIISYLKPKVPKGDVVPRPESVVVELVFDKRLAQCSLGLDCAADTLIALAPTSSQISFIALSSLSSFASGGNPALHSLGAVCLHASGSGSEVGALFGGIAVLSAVAHVISPYVSALTYSSTVAYFPKAIFSFGAFLLGSIVLLLSGIKARPEEMAISEVRRQFDDNDEETISY